MKKQIVPLFIILSVSACNSFTPKSDEAVPTNSITTETPKTENQQALASYDPIERYSELFWVEQANPVNDALLAISQGDTKLWGYNTRAGTKTPGTDNVTPEILSKYRLKIAPAMGDIIYSNKHLKLRLKFIHYATQYNKEILKH